MINSLHVVQCDEHPTKVHTASFFDKFKANPNLESTVQVWMMPYTMGPTYVKGALHYPTDKLLTGIIVNKTYCTVHQ